MASPITRRDALAALSAALGTSSTSAAAVDPWTNLPDLLKRIQEPEFPSRDFPVTRHGAKGDGKSDSTQAFRAAIAECSAAGGGRVVVTEGVFLTGPIHLKSSVNLHVAAGATVRFSRDPKQYLPAVYTRWEGIECMGYSPMIYSFEQRNLAITGAGTLDGNSDCEHWWPWKGRTNCGWKKGDPSQQKARDLLHELAEKDVPVAQRKFGDQSFMRPQFVQPYRCQNVLIEGITILNSPMWELNPVLCRNVTVRKVSISSHGPNNDGCDPESCSGVLIDGCTFDTGDDCIAIKSGRNRDGRRVNAPSENIVVQNCVMKDGHGGVTLGSECSGGIRNVFARNCRMDSPHLDRVLRIKTNAVRGGVIERVYMRDIEVGQVSGAAIDIDFNYEEGNQGEFKPVVRDIAVANLRCRKSLNALSLRGFPDAPIRNVRLEHCTFDHTSEANVVQHVEGLVLEDVRIDGRRA